MLERKAPINPLACTTIDFEFKHACSNSVQHVREHQHKYSTTQLQICSIDSGSRCQLTDIHQHLTLLDRLAVISSAAGEAVEWFENTLARLSSTIGMAIRSSQLNQVEEVALDLMKCCNSR